MSYIRQVPDQEATGHLRDLYDQDLREDGYISNSTSIYSLRPDFLVAWRATVKELRKHIRLRQYELITIASARAIGCKY